VQLTFDENRERVVAGLMSGTSVDAIDVALLRVTPDAKDISIDVIAYSETLWTCEERDAILRVSTERVTTQEMAIVDRMIGERFCAALKQVAKLYDVRIDAIGFHGQTVAHVPTPPGGHSASTLQLGNPYTCAQTFKCPVVFDFRRADMVTGGQGAPLVPAADSLMFHRALQSGPIAIQNIGGIGNVTYLAADRPPMGFDTGPGNMVLDQVMFMRTGSAFDDAGKIAATGTVSLNLLEALSDWHIPSPPPVSYGREHFGKNFVDRILAVSERVSTADLMASVSEWTATTISQAMFSLPSKPKCVYICGGGAHNKDLIRRFERLSGIKTMPLDSIGIPGDAREAAAFAVLADARLRGVTFDLRQVTGSQVRQGLGAIALP
jgi:anhydro-N-acetylmuramic acid kinase